MCIRDRPKAWIEAVWRALSSHGESGGDTQPSAQCVVRVTTAEEGTSVVSTLATAADAASASTDGGSRNESTAVVDARSTLPAIAGSGTSPIPTMDSVAPQLRRRI